MLSSFCLFFILIFLYTRFQEESIKNKNTKKRKRQSENEKSAHEAKIENRQYLENMQHFNSLSSSPDWYTENYDYDDIIVTNKDEDENNEKKSEDHKKQEKMTLKDEEKGSYIKRIWGSDTEHALLVCYSIMLEKSSSDGTVKYGTWQSIINLFNQNNPTFQITSQEARNKYQVLFHFFFLIFLIYL